MLLLKPYLLKKRYLAKLRAQPAIAEEEELEDGAHHEKSDVYHSSISSHLHVFILGF
jgi:hypothetical protein